MIEWARARFINYRLCFLRPVLYAFKTSNFAIWTEIENKYLLLLLRRTYAVRYKVLNHLNLHAYTETHTHQPTDALSYIVLIYYNIWQLMFRPGLIVTLTGSYYALIFHDIFYFLYLYLMCVSLMGIQYSELNFKEIWFLIVIIFEATHSFYVLLLVYVSVCPSV